MPSGPVYLFNDFGSDGPYLAQLECQFLQIGKLPVISLASDAPQTDPYHAAYLLAALYRNLPVRQGYLLAVVDPGVGSSRNALLVSVRDLDIVAPDNGLLSRLMAEQGISQAQLLARPANLLSDSFHARDWFAPALLRHIQGESVSAGSVGFETLVGADWPQQIAEVIYIDHYGNLFTGLNADALQDDAILVIKGHEIGYSRVFAEALPGQLLWYRNSAGLIEISANRANAAQLLRAAIGDPVSRS